MFLQPLIYAAAAFALGIAVAGGSVAGGRAAAWLTLLEPWLAVLWMAALPAALVLLGFLPQRRTGSRRAAVALGMLACLSAGYARARAVIEHPAPPSALSRALARLQPQPHDKVWLIGYARDTPEILYDANASSTARPSAMRLELEAVGLARSSSPSGTIAGTLDPVSGGVRLYAYPPRAASGTAAVAAADSGDESWLAPLRTIRAGEGLAVQVHLRALAVYRDPGVADYAASARRQGTEYTATLAVHGWRAWPAIAAPRSLIWRARLWRWMSVRIDRLASPAKAPELNALLRGMLLGDASRLQQATRTTFQIDGVYHLLVVAGLHIGVLFGFFFFIFRRFRLPPAGAGGLSLLLLAGYSWVIAGRAPTERAWLMLAIYFAAQLWYRERQGLNAVGFAALILMLAHPLDLFGPSLQLTLGAALLLTGVAAPLLGASLEPLRRASRGLDNVGADAAFTPRMAQFRLDLRAFALRLRWLWPPLGDLLPVFVRILVRAAEIVAISLILQLGFAAFNAAYFHRASPYAVLANAVLVPAAGGLIPLAWLGLTLGSVSTLMGPALAWLIGAWGGFMLRFAAALAGWPGADWRVPSPPGWALALFGVLAVTWIAIFTHAARASQRPLAPLPGSSWMGESPSRRWRRPAGATAAVATMAVVLAAAPFSPRLPPGLSATILDVGQGDSIFVSFPDGRTLLVDGGPRSAHWDTGEAVVAPFLWSLGLRHIDAVLLTHAHNDHLGGLPTVIEDFHPSVVWVSDSLPHDPAVGAFLRVVQRSGAGLRRTVAGDTYLAGAARFQVLLPPPDYQAGVAPSNDDSVAVRISWGNESMLLEGDAEAVGERWMLAHGLPLASTILKVGHHGSRTSSTEAFLAAVHPRVAVISDATDNIYGFPAPIVLRHLQAAGARVFRTDRDGAVQCRLEQGWLRVYLFRRWPAT